MRNLATNQIDDGAKLASVDLGNILYCTYIFQQKHVS